MKDIFFGANPTVMWIYERDSLKIMAVNEAAIVLYGYSKQDKLSWPIEWERQSYKLVVAQDISSRKILELNEDQILGEIAKKIIL